MSKAPKVSLSVILQQFADELLEKAAVLDETVERDLFAAFSSVPRHIFVDESYAQDCYSDYALPLTFGQIISKPSVVARMLALAGLSRGKRVLEIGSGSGYTAALMGTIGAQVYGMEESGFLAQKTRKLLDSLGYSNILIGRGDGLKGWSEYAPYDAIIIWFPCEVGDIDPSLFTQLVRGGKVVAPIGDHNRQVLHLWQNIGDSVSLTKLEECRLLGGHEE